MVICSPNFRLGGRRVATGDTAHLCASPRIDAAFGVTASASRHLNLVDCCA